MSAFEGSLVLYFKAVKMNNVFKSMRLCVFPRRLSILMTVSLKSQLNTLINKQISSSITMQELSNLKSIWDNSILHVR